MRLSRPGTRTSDRERGQTLVEFALVVPIFLLLVFGLVDVGRLVFTNTTLSQAARESARLAATEANWIGSTHAACVPDESGITSARPGAHVCPPDVATFRAHVTSAARRMTAAVGPIDTLYISCNDGTDADPLPSGAWTESSGGNGCTDEFGNASAGSDDLVSVRVEYTYDVVTPIVSSILGSTLLTGSASMAIN